MFSEHELTQADFEKLSRLIYEQSGIALHEGKKDLVRARLGKRLREGKFKSFRDYYQFVVQDESGEELVSLLDSISTNLTSFFREQIHFDFLQTDLLPRWRAARPGRDKTLHIWSAGSSSGGGSLLHRHHSAGKPGDAGKMEDPDSGFGYFHPGAEESRRRHL